MRKRGLELARGFISRHLILWVVALAVVGLALCWHLGAVPLSPAEQSSLGSSKSLHSLINNPINAPHQVFEYGLQHFHHASARFARLISVLYYLVFVLCFYAIVRNWFGKFSARLGALLLGATPLLILVARSATSDIMYLFPLTVIVSYMLFVRSRKHLNLMFMLLCALAAVSLYQPGGLIFLVAGILYIRPVLAQAVKKFSKKIVLLNAVVFLALLAPLGWAIAKDPHLLKPLLLVPNQLPSPMDFIKWFGWSTLALIWHSGQHNYLQIGKLAVLDISQIAFICFGVYALWDRALGKAYMLAALVGLVILETALNQNYLLLIISLPALMVFATAGLRYLHIEWNSVFPRNPLPRGLALLLLLSIVALHVFWGAHYSLTAWPHSFGLFT